MNHTKLIAMAFVVLICLATMPAAAQIPFEISGYVHFPDGSASLDPTVAITNLNTSAVLPVMTLPSSNYYQAKPAPLLNEISENDVLEFRASAGTDSAVIEHRILTSDLNSGGLYLNITLDLKLFSDTKIVRHPKVKLDKNPYLDMEYFDLRRVKIGLCKKTNTFSNKMMNA